MTTVTAPRAILNTHARDFTTALSQPSVVFWLNSGMVSLVKSIEPVTMAAGCFGAVKNAKLETVGGSNAIENLTASVCLARPQLGQYRTCFATKLLRGNNGARPALRTAPTRCGTGAPLVPMADHAIDSWCTTEQCNYKTVHSPSSKRTLTTCVLRAMFLVVQRWAFLAHTEVVAGNLARANLYASHACLRANTPFTPSGDDAVGV